MRISYNGLQFLKEREGFKDTAYRDSAGIWTIGYGTTKIKGVPVVQGQTITEKEAEECLEDDLSWAQEAVNQGVKVRLTQGMFDALVSFVYNVGGSAFTTSTLRRLLNGGMYEEASEQFHRWKYAGGKVIPGLVNRRRLEFDLFWK